LPLIAIAWAAGTVGDAVGFLLGRRRGRAVLLGSGARVGVDSAGLDRLQALISRWGGVALVGGRFAGPVRAFAPFLVGASGARARRLVGASVAGAGVWSATFTLGGYGFAHSFESHLQVAGNVALGVSATATLAWALRRRGKPRPSVASA
jgi:undecaprenyl-diphosphatase